MTSTPTRDSQFHANVIVRICALCLYSNVYIYKSAMHFAQYCIIRTVILVCVCVCDLFVIYLVYLIIHCIIFFIHLFSFINVRFQCSIFKKRSQNLFSCLYFQMNLDR